jgi:hypothetical protein
MAAMVLIMQMVCLLSCPTRPSRSRSLSLSLFVLLNSVDKLVLPQKYAPVENIRFNTNKNETSMFAITCTNGVIFGHWVSRYVAPMPHSAPNHFSLEGLEAEEKAPPALSSALNFHKFPLQRYGVCGKLQVCSLDNAVRKRHNME